MLLAALLFLIEPQLPGWITSVRFGVVENTGLTLDGRHGDFPRPGNFRDPRFAFSYQYRDICRLVLPRRVRRHVAELSTSCLSKLLS